NDCFLISSDMHQRMISPNRIDSIAVTRSCMISSSAIELAVRHGVPIYFFGETGEAEARLWSPYFGTISSLRKQQTYFSDHPEMSFEWIREILVIRFRVRWTLSLALKRSYIWYWISQKMGWQSISNY